MRSALWVVVACLVATSLLGACSDSPQDGGGQPVTLAGTSWRVISVDGKVPVPGAEPTAMFGADQVRGSGSCNSYGGAYRFDPATGQIEFQNLGMTAMACAEQARNEYEGIFSAALVRASSASFDSDGRLVLSGPGSRIVLVPVG